MPPASYNMPPSTVTPSVPPLSPIAPASDYPLSFAHHPLHALHSLSWRRGPGIRKCCADYLRRCPCGVGMEEHDDSSVGVCRSRVFTASVAGQQAAEPESATPALGKLPVPADRPAGDAGTAAALGAPASRPATAPQLRRDAYQLRSGGKRGSSATDLGQGDSERLPCSPFRPSSQTAPSMTSEVHNPPVYGTRVLRAKIKFWSDNGGSRESVLAEKIGAVPVVRLMAKAVPGHDGGAASAGCRVAASPRQSSTAVATRRARRPPGRPIEAD